MFFLRITHGIAKFFVSTFKLEVFELPFSFFTIPMIAPQRFFHSFPNWWLRKKSSFIFYLHFEAFVREIIKSEKWFFHDEIDFPWNSNDLTFHWRVTIVRVFVSVHGVRRRTHTRRQIRKYYVQIKRSLSFVSSFIAIPEAVNIFVSASVWIGDLAMKLRGFLGLASVAFVLQCSFRHRQGLIWCASTR